jgi:hypothetical protein
MIAPRLARVEEAASLPPPADAVRLASFPDRHHHWSVFWDKRQCLWRAAEDDPGSDLYIASPDADAVIGYITTHS